MPGRIPGRTVVIAFVVLGVCKFSATIVGPTIRVFTVRKPIITVVPASMVTEVVHTLVSDTDLVGFLRRTIVIEILRKNPIHGKKTKKRKQPVLEINQPSTRPALTYYNDDDQVLDHVSAVILL